MAADSKSSVLAAVVGNTLVMAAKFVAFGLTGSGAMFSEAIHTLADVLNQVLLLVGIVRSGRSPDRRYPYGYGQERFIWALVSAVGIFFLGCGVTVYHGIQELLHPSDVSDLTWAVVVLVISLVIEGIVLVIAFRGLKTRAGDRPFFQYLRNDADPSAVAVLLEDAAACTGVIIALAAILLAEVTGQQYWDAIGSLLIGLLLGAIAIWLMLRNRELLIGRNIPLDARQRIRQVLLKRATVDQIVELKGKVLDTESYDVMVALEFDGAKLVERLEPEIRAVWAQIQSADDFEAFCARFARQVLELLGDEVDALEAAIQQEVPEVKHIDVEPN